MYWTWAAVMPACCTSCTRQGWRGHYTGLDGSAELLALAEGSATALAGLQPRFVRADLAEADWGACLDLHGGAAGARPDAVAALAVLHHIPGAVQRAGFLAQVAELAAGVLVVSTWQFLTPRLRTRILPWQAAGLSPEAVEPGDYLLSWGQGAAGQRYCAFIGEEALAGLAAAAGMQLVETFYADGYEGNLNLYGVLQIGSRE